MNLETILHDLGQPAAYPTPTGPIETRQTHISLVFLTRDCVYKVRKPVRMSFLDFSTLEKRYEDCLNEVRLNHRLAPDVYLGVVPIVATDRGLAVEGPGEAVEWAVKMRRLPDEATLLHRVRYGQLSAESVAEFAHRVAEFHRRADRGPEISKWGQSANVSRNILENLNNAEPELGVTLHPDVARRIRQGIERQIAQLSPLMDSRAAQDMPRECHGDLHLAHIYHFPDYPPPGDWVAIDCIEFNERFRFIDPVAEVAFTIMDLRFRGRPDLADAFESAYFQASGDEQGRQLLPLYVAYRAMVRGSVEGIVLREPEVPDDTKRTLRASARKYWLLALGTLEPATTRPLLVLVAGLPGTGKSTLARLLSEAGSFDVIRSDVVRKELASSEPGAADIYSADMSRKTYEECLRRAEMLLFQGRRVIVDANFRSESQRQDFAALAESLAVPIRLIVCSAPDAIIRDRLNQRQNDASDADWAVYQKLQAEWQPPSDRWHDRLLPLNTSGPNFAIAETLQWLHAR